MPTYGEAVAGFKAVQQYMCSFKMDDASLTSVREGVAVHSTDMPRRCLLAYFKK
jgi:hypothetical protein